VLLCGPARTCCGSSRRSPIADDEFEEGLEILIAALDAEA